MKVDVEKLIQILHEIYEDVDGDSCTSAVCIAEAIGVHGMPIQIQILATNDVDELIAGGGTHYRCVEI